MVGTKTPRPCSGGPPGLLMPASDDPKKDREIFLKLMTMDEEGLWRRRRGNIPAAEVYQYATETEREFYFTRKGDKWQWKKSASREDREHMQRRAFNRMSYDEKLSYCMRPEEIEGPSEEAWKEINAHLGTNVNLSPGFGARIGKTPVRSHSTGGGCLLWRRKRSF